jgi:hypothetical protein
MTHVGCTISRYAYATFFAPCAALRDVPYLGLHPDPAVPCACHAVHPDRGFSSRHARFWKPRGARIIRRTEELFLRKLPEGGMSFGTCRRPFEQVHTRCICACC